MDDAQVVSLPARNRRRPGRERLDPARRGARPETAWIGHGHWTGASRPAVRARPNMMLKHSTPWPEAPLTRLSRAAVTTAFLPCAETLTRQRLECVASLVVGVLPTTRTNGWPA